jgi:hypothetical protein
LRDFSCRQGFRAGFGSPRGVTPASPLSPSDASMAFRSTAPRSATPVPGSVTSDRRSIQSEVNLCSPRGSCSLTALARRRRGATPSPYAQSNRAAGASRHACRSSQAKACGTPADAPATVQQQRGHLGDRASRAKSGSLLRPLVPSQPVGMAAWGGTRGGRVVGSPRPPGSRCTTTPRPRASPSATAARSPASSSSGPRDGVAVLSPFRVREDGVGAVARPTTSRERRRSPSPESRWPGRVERAALAQRVALAQDRRESDQRAAGTPSRRPAGGAKSRASWTLIS